MPVVCLLLKSVIHLFYRGHIRYVREIYYNFREVEGHEDFSNWGAGYIGSHTCVELLNSGYEVVVMDNLYNASAKALDRVQQITGKTLTFYEADMLDQPAMDKIFEAEKPDAVIHFAGYKAVGESVVKPIEYYHNNMTGTLLLCDTMRKHGVKTLFSVLLLQYMEIRWRSQSQKNARNRVRPTLMVRPRLCWSRC